MDKEDRTRACYQHCCLRYVSREHMNNASLRERFGIEGKNSATVSRVIKDAEAGTKAMRYVPHWS
jgi:ATP-dependent DNA helicase RecG